MNRKKICTAVLAVALCASMTLPAHAVYDPMKAMEEASRQAVAAAIKAGTVPQGTTIYDCGYSTDANGVTIVVRYKDKNGNWIDIITQKKTSDMPAGTSSSANKPTEKLSDETLAEYAAEVFRLVNEEREKAGLDPVSYREDIADAANIRSKELASMASHTRPNGDKCFTVLDEQNIQRKWAGENLHYGKSTPESAMKAWMDSDGHRAIMLNEKATAMGVGVYQTQDGKIGWIQLFIKEK